MKLFKKKEKDILENSWDKFYDKDKRNIEVPNISIYDYLERVSVDFEDEIALNYFGETTTFYDLISKIKVCANALQCYGVRENDTVTICMPNTPEAIISFYAVNKIGAIANIIHPLSAEQEIKDSLIKTKSTVLIAINLSFKKIDNIIDSTSVYKTIIVSPKDSMPPILAFGYSITKDLKLEIPNNEKYMSWKTFMNKGNNYDGSTFVKRGKDSDAIYLHTGGTTGVPKNIVLTNGNVNAIMEQAKIILPKIGVEDSFLSILPMFHCFGLVVCICAPLTLGATTILIPQFDAKRFDKLIRKYKPTILAGVPTLYEALITNPFMINLDMSFVKYVISGGDSLSPEKNKLVNEFLQNHGSKAHLIQGYGMTETTGPACFGALGSDKLGSVGIPLPGNKIKIINVDTKEEMKENEIGEICVSGPIIMSRYLNDPKETSNILKKHQDGLDWIHTGDLGYVDKDGVLFFVQRLKRMLIVSGYNVYPSHVEGILLKNEMIENCGIIGVPDPYRIQKPVAYIILKDKYKNMKNIEKELKEYCIKNMAKYMIPREFIFKDELPKTIIGKIDYRKLEKDYK